MTYNKSNPKFLPPEKSAQEYERIISDLQTQIMILNIELESLRNKKAPLFEDDDSDDDVYKD